MNSLVLRSSILAALIAVPVGVASAANDGTIEITGRIVATTCQVEGKPPGENAANKLVALGDISSTVLATAGQTAGDRGFSIVIGGNSECTDGASAKVRFDPASPALDRETGRLNVDPVVGAATNVQVQITEQDGTPINMYTQDSKPVTISGNVAKVELMARYYSLGNITGGLANSRVGFQIVYE
jgi:major type 1 subunit fimbrin (pilin)